MEDISILIASNFKIRVYIMEQRTKAFISQDELAAVLIYVRS